MRWRASILKIFLACLVATMSHACWKNVPSEEHRYADLAESYYQIRDSYQETQGREQENTANANRALKGLSEILSRSFYPDAWYLAVDICRRHGKETLSICIQLSQKTVIDSGSEVQVLHLIIGQTAIAFNPLLWNDTPTEKQFCTHGAIRSTTTDGRYRDNNALQFIRALQSFCSNEKVKADELLRRTYATYQNGMDTHLEMFRTLILSLAIAIHLGVEDAMLFQTCVDLLRRRDYASLSSVVGAKRNSIIAKIYSAEIINPYDALSPFADKNSISKVRATTREISRTFAGCQLLACHYIASEGLRLGGEADFIEHRYESALKAGEKCLEQIPQKTSCLSLILATGLSLGRPDIHEKYATSLNSQLRSSFLFRELEHVTENNAFKPSTSNEGSGKILPQHKITILARKILSQMLSSAYLKGRIPADIQVIAVDYDNAEVFSAGGKSQIFLGVHLVDRILKKIQNKQYRTDISEEDIVAAVLGHEIHHVVAGDPLFHCSLKYTPEYFAASRKLEATRVEKESKRDDAWRREYNADEMGSLYAFLTGHRAGALLHVLADWAQKEPVMKYYSTKGDPHPPHLLRIEALMSKIQILQTVANAFKMAEEHLKSAEKLAQKHSSRYNRAIARHLEQADYGLDWVAAKLPGHEALINNRAVIKIQRALLEEPAPEVPIYPQIQSHVDFVAPVEPITAGQIKNLIGDRMPDTSDPSNYIYRFRPSLFIPLLNTGTASAKLKEALTILKGAHSKYPGNKAITYNLAFCHYALAQLQVRLYHARKRKNPAAQLSLQTGDLGNHLQKAVHLIIGHSANPEIKNLLFAIAVAHLHTVESSQFSSKDRIYCKVLRTVFDENYDCSILEAAGKQQAAIHGLFFAASQQQSSIRFTLFELLIVLNAEELYSGDSATVKLMSDIYGKYLTNLPAFWKQESTTIVQNLAPQSSGDTSQAEEKHNVNGK